MSACLQQRRFWLRLRAALTSPIRETEQQLTNGATEAWQNRPPEPERRGWWAKALRAVGSLPMLFVVVLGMLVGIGVYTFGYGQGWRYLSNDPLACTNCHVMQGHFDSWQKASHHHVAVCNDCHLPHAFLGKWVTKMDNGFFHSLAFTTGDFHEPIQIKPRNRRVTLATCLYCHGDVVHQMLPREPQGEMLACIHCHSDVGHAHK
jgi:cytochrome c nitrite reductase small subunit